jgi:hypothetical protein
MTEESSIVGREHRSVAPAGVHPVADPAGIARRAFSRWPFEGVRLLLERTDTVTDEPVECYCKNLSASGLGLLTSRPLDPGTPVEVALPHRYRGMMRIAGILRRCEERTEGVFELGIQFETLLNPREYVTVDPLSNNFVVESVNPQDIGGRVTMFAFSRSLRARFCRVMSKTSAVYHQTDLIIDAGRLAAKAEVLLLGIAHTGDPHAALRRISQRGFQGRVLAIASDRAPRTRALLRDLPCHSVIVDDTHEEQLILRALADMSLMGRFARN